MISLKASMKFLHFLVLATSFYIHPGKSDFIAETDPYYDSNRFRIFPPHVPIGQAIPPAFLENTYPYNTINSPPVPYGGSDGQFSLQNENSESSNYHLSAENSKTMAHSAHSHSTSTTLSTSKLPHLIRSTSVNPPKMSEAMKLYHSEINELPQVQCVDPEGNIGICQAHSKCASFYPQFLQSKNMEKSVCLMADGNNGICCQPVLGQKVTLPLMQPKRVDLYVNNEKFIEKMGEDLENVAEIVHSASTKADELERVLLENSDNIVERGTAAHGHLQFFMTSSKALSLARFGASLLDATRQVKARMNIDDEMAGNGLRRYSLLRTSAKDQCISPGKCDPYYNYYRTIDGSCNNLNRSEMGMAFTPLYRILPPNYADGLWTPRTSVLGPTVELPNVRKLSASIAIDQDHPHAYNSLWVMQFGQFVDHDMTHVPTHRYQNYSGIECCSKNGRYSLQVNQRHPMCYPIQIAKEDPFYRAYRQRCMNFVRSMISPRPDCSLGYGDQLNQITSFLDNSNVYGSRLEEQKDLRLMKDGLLKYRSLSGKGNVQMLPIKERPGDECTHSDNNTYCNNAGDLRANEGGALTAIHVLWFREHNRIARILKTLNPSWSDEILYFEARRIVNAEYQHIVYSEWLPIIVGRKFLTTYGIAALYEGYAKDYDLKIDPTVSNAFAAAAYRMGHSLIQGIISLQNEVDSQEEGEVYLIHENFNRPTTLETVGMLDKLLLGLGTNPIQNFDSYFSHEVTHRLFQPLKNHFGMDLVSLNIQRGRDHGLPSYNEFRNACKLGKAKTFDDLLHNMSAVKVNQLRRSYRSVDDIDLFIGGLCENPISGAILGPTFVCLVGDQFARAKKADRFAYDLGGQEHSFSPAQLREIRKANLARIICDNSDNIKRTHPLSFHLPNDLYNPMVSCDSPMIQKVDLSYWKHY